MIITESTNVKRHRFFVHMQELGYIRTSTFLLRPHGSREETYEVRGVGSVNTP